MREVMEERILMQGDSLKLKLPAGDIPISIVLLEFRGSARHRLERRICALPIVEPETGTITVQLSWVEE